MYNIIGFFKNKIEKITFKKLLSYLLMSTENICNHCGKNFKNEKTLLTHISKFHPLANNNNQKSVVSDNQPVTNNQKSVVSDNQPVTNNQKTVLSNNKKTIVSNNQPVTNNQ